MIEVPLVVRLSAPSLNPVAVGYATAAGTASGQTTISAAIGPTTGATMLTVTQPQPAPQTIAFEPLPARTFGDAAFTLAKGSQAIAFPALAGRRVGDAPFVLAATASSSLLVTFTASGPCSVTGATVRLTGAGTCTITARQAGDASYEAAAPVARSFTITAPPLRCTVPNLAGKTLAAAKQALTKARCATGKVTRRASRGPGGHEDQPGGEPRQAPLTVRPS